MQTVYMDNAATLFPKSPTVLKAMETAFNTCGNGGRGTHALALAATETIYGCREALAALFGCQPQNVVLCGGATLALNMAIKGLYTKGGGVLTSTMEHNAVLRPLYGLARRGDIKLRFFTPSLSSATKTLSAYAAALRPDTRLAVFTHASNICGMCLPVKEMCTIARERGIITVVDCAQTAGHLPVDIKALGADVLCIAGHKGLGGPMGIGALIINDNSHLRFKPLIEGGTGIASKERAMPAVLPERLEAGTVNITGIAGLAAACKELSVNHAAEEAQRRLLVSRLSAIDGVQVYGGGSDAPYAPMVLFNINGVSAPAAEELLAQRGVYTRGGLHCAPLAHSTLGTGLYGAVRASLGRGNTAADCHALLAAVKEIATGKI